MNTDPIVYGIPVVDIAAENAFADAAAADRDARLDPAEPVVIGPNSTTGRGWTA